MSDTQNSLADEIGTIVHAFSDPERKERVKAIARRVAEALEWKHMLSIWGGTPEIVNSFIKGQQDRILAAQEAENQRDELRAIAKDYLAVLHILSLGGGEREMKEYQKVLAAVKGGQHE